MLERFIEHQALKIAATMVAAMFGITTADILFNTWFFDELLSLMIGGVLYVVIKVLKTISENKKVDLSG